MNWIRLIISAFLVLLSYIHVGSQTFPCDGTLLFSTNQGFPPSQIFKVFMAPFGVTTFNPLYPFPNVQFDALGFNSTDNYIYGVKVNSNEIIRIKSNGTFETVGQVSMVDVLDAGSGDCTADGLYVLHDNSLDQLLIYDVVNTFALVDQIDLFWDPNSRNSGLVTTQFGDIAIDPNNPGITYTYQGDFNDPDLEPNRTRGYLHRINIDRGSDNVGMVTPVGRIPPDIILKMGSLFFTAGGGLHGYGAYSRGLNLKQNRLISIDQFSGNATAFDASGPIAEVTDGCSCPYSVSFANVADPLDVLCTNTEITFKLTITNRFFYSLNDLVITDTLPDGMVIKEIIGDKVGEIAPGTGVGTQHLTLTGVNVPAKGAVNVNIVATVIDIGIEFIPNQAHLKNLPERLGSIMLSDDPSTINSLGDPTKFFGNSQRLNEFEVSIVHPTDCLEDTTGTVLFSSPVLAAGEQYQVNLRDQNFNVSSYEGNHGSQ